MHPDDAVAELRRLPFADLGFARVDHHRACAKGWPRPSTDRARPRPGRGHRGRAARRWRRAGAGHPCRRRQADAALAANPGGADTGTLVWRPAAAPARAEGGVAPPAPPTCRWPTSAAVLAAFGLDPVRLTDVGVAGVHRLLAEADALATADAVVVVAGMEGALASVVGGLTPAPVVAVPTSVGYGASLEGVTALLAMLASCAAGITVVGIDNGYGAACAVLRMLK